MGEKHFPNGDIYKGRFVNGDMEGKGKLIKADGTIFEGNFLKNHLQGKGAPTDPNKVTYPNGDTYVGEFIDTVETGQGQLVIATGTYVGEVVNGLPHGKGHFIWNNGSSYYGDFLEGQMTGKGTITYENGEK